MNTFVGREGTQVLRHNPNDVLAPHRERGGRTEDYQWLIDETAIFMQANPETVHCMEQFAVILISAAQGNDIGQQDIITLPKPIPEAGGRKFPGSAPADPIVGLRLILDSRVKSLTSNQWFVHHLDPLKYQKNQFPGSRDDYTYDTFGLIAVDNTSNPSTYHPDFALAISNDRTHAAIIHRVPDSELSAIYDGELASRIASLALDRGRMRHRDNYLRLYSGVRNALLSGDLAPIDERSIVAIIGAECLIYMTATIVERLELEPTGDPSVESLYAIMTILDSVPSDEVVEPIR